MKSGNRAGLVDVSRSGKSRPALHSHGSMEKKIDCETKFAKALLILNKPVFRINIEQKNSNANRFLLLSLKTTK